MKKKITVYSASTCPHCAMVKAFLTEFNIPFTDLDVGMNREAAREMVMKSNQLGVPVIDIDGDIIVGFDRAGLSRALDLEQ